MNNQKIIALVANIGAGKSFVADYITEKYDAENIKTSDKLKNILNILHLDLKRENFASMSQALREMFGQNVLGNATFEDIKNSTSEIILLDGVRRSEDISEIEKEENFYLVFINTSLETRSKRMSARAEKTDDTNINTKVLGKNEQHDSENRVDGLKEKADFIIDNNGTLEDLEKNIDEVMNKILKK